MKHRFPWRFSAGFLVLTVFCLLAESTWGQVTPSSYPFPKPHPTTGNLPANIIRYSQTLGPSAYGNENAVLWSIDIGGGLHSRLNAADRLALNPFWTQEGAIIYDATDGIYYGVGPDLKATIPLFSMHGVPGATIYTGDGTLTGDRNVYSGGHTMNFNFMSGTTNAGWFQVTFAQYIGLNALTNTMYSDHELNIFAGRDVKVSAPTWTNVVTDFGTLVNHDWRLYTSNQTWLSSQTFDITGTNILDLQSIGHLGLYGGTIDTVATTNLTLAALKDVRLLGMTITNAAGQLYLVGTNGIWALASGPLFLDANNANLIGTNYVNIQSSGDMGINGGNVIVNATTNLTMAALKDVRLIGQTITNGANTIYLVGTNGIYAFAAGPLFLDALNANLIGTNYVNIQSSGDMGISGGNIVATASTNFTVAASKDVRLIGQTITNGANTIYLVGTNGISAYAAGSLFLDANNANLIGTNYVTVQSSGDMTVAGGNIIVNGTTNLTLAANQQVLLIGKLITNAATDLVILGTNTVKATSGTLLSLNGREMDLLGTNRFTAQGGAQFTIGASNGPGSIYSSNLLTMASASTSRLSGSIIQVAATTAISNTAPRIDSISTGTNIIVAAGPVLVDGTTVGISSRTKSTVGSDTAVEISAPQVTVKSNLNLASADFARGLVKSNYVWTLINPANGLGEWRAPETLTSLYREYQYKWASGAVATNVGPGNQYAAIDTTSFATAHYVMVNVQDITAVSHRDDLLTGPIGQKLRVEQDFDQWGDFTTTGRPVDMVTYIIYPVSPSASQGLLPDANATVKVAFGTATALTTTPIANIDVVASLLWVPTGPNGLYNFANTLGYYSLNDGGGGIYYSTTFNSSLTNRGNFQSMFDKTKMWSLLQPRDGIFLKQYGAKGDANNDDTLSVKDWLHDINFKVGIVNVGTYSISPLYIEANASLTIRGNSRFGLTSPNISSGLFIGNCATFQRRLTPGQEALSLFNVVSNATLNAYNLVFDGNKAVETLATNAYLYLNNGGKSSEIESCYFANSAGHGISIVGPGGNWSVVRNSRIYDVARGMRLNQTSGVILNNLHIQLCRDNGLWLLGYATLTRVNDLFVSDCTENGIILESSQHNRFANVEVQNTWKSALLFNVASGNTANDTAFVQSTFMTANALTTLNGTSPYPPSTYSTVMVTGTANTDYAIRGRFSGCMFGDITGAKPSRGKYNFEWAVPTGGVHYAWEGWMFEHNQHTWCPQWVADFSPGFTNTVSELGVMHANNEFNHTFGKSGAITSQGWRVDIIESGTNGGNNAVVYANNSNHKLLRDTAGFGTPIATVREPVQIIPPPPEPKTGPIPDP